MPLRCLLVVVIVLVWSAGARADVTLTEGPPELGYAHLTAGGDGARVVEEVGGQDVEIAGGAADARVRWTCRTERQFAAVNEQERSPSLTVTTPSCAGRLRVTAAPGVRVGGNVRISVIDRWRLGDLAATVCVTPPRRPQKCADVGLPDGQDVAHAVFRATRAGTWPVTVTSQVATVARTVTVGPQARTTKPTVLFTGDSMMLATRHVLAQRLRGAARTVDDIYVGSGITRPFVIDWAKLPRRQVRAYRPDATVISLGMGDGRDLPTAAGPAACCEEPWVAAYAQRVRRIMRAYLRDGHGAVVWFTNPFDRDPARWPYEAAVNAAVARAAVGLERVDVIDLAAILTPGGRYRAHTPVHGRRTRIRTGDGIHLTLAGARIAARPAMRSLRDLGVLGP